jgi:hypothetical protein
MKLTSVVQFTDWDVLNCCEIRDDFPAGTLVKPIDRYNPDAKTRLFCVLGVDGYIAQIPMAHFEKQ